MYKDLIMSIVWSMTVSDSFESTEEAIDFFEAISEIIIISYATRGSRSTEILSIGSTVH